ncbi:MAG: ribosomal protein S5-alanine N-acetyltransferase [Pseudomonadota bacterium]
MPVPLLETDRLSIIRLEHEDWAALNAYYQDNAAHLDPWEPRRSADFHTEASWCARLALSQLEREEGRAVKCTLRLRDSQAMIGVCNFTNIVRGAFQACTLGYSLAATAEGKGLMFEALSASITYMFEIENLHRVMANYIPENRRSADLLRRLGFDVEGHARDYLHINGAWRDHVLTAKINPHFKTS